MNQVAWSREAIEEVALIRVKFLADGGYRARVDGGDDGRAPDAAAS
jgi:hypothetical protein